MGWWREEWGEEETGGRREGEEETKRRTRRLEVKRTMERRRVREVSLLGSQVHRGRLSTGASGASLT